MKALVTGGGGFLGFAIVKELRARGHEVISLSRQAHPHVDETGARHQRGDITRKEDVLRAAEGCGVIFHVAAKPGIWGPWNEYHAINVRGTEHVLEACRAHRIPHLIHTSTPSVIYSPRGVSGADESIPYPEKFEAHYPHTKAIAERAVLAANSETLKTVALRPHLIWGPGDNQLSPRLAARARAGKLRIVGGGETLIDTVFIDNAARAHVQAWDELRERGRCAGKAYFITQGEPRPVRQVLESLLAAMGMPQRLRSIPAPVAWTAGALMEAVYTLLGRQDEPMMTRFLAHQLSTPHWYDISAARRDFGYAPAISFDEGLQRLSSDKTWLASLK
ncbi:MAG: 2-alkyl-3-oxoalkanoate reductase [Myxococcota bacterium]|nr:2-alkyl-3-oxoalkanoate reductase [Myxococcota bacterium]